MYNGYRAVYATVGECMEHLQNMIRAVEEDGFCEMAVMDETLCTNPHEWGWRKLGYIAVMENGKAIKVMDRPTARRYGESVAELQITHDLLKILIADNVNTIEQLMNAYREHRLRAYNGIGKIHEMEIISALDEWQRRTR